jgi:hypothetical protein
LEKRIQVIFLLLFLCLDYPFDKFVSKINLNVI